jgi:putative DNA primase/helicase
MPHGQGIRCVGFVTDDGYIHCTREEHAGPLEASGAAVATFAHIDRDDCRCGVPHSRYGAVAGATPKAAPKSSSHAPRRIVATYDYQAADGRVLFRVKRFTPKGFMPETPTADGGWLASLNRTPRVLYRLPQLIAAPGRVVLVTEGEKDADRLASLGLLSTTNCGGAESWQRHATEYAEAFRGRSRAVIMVHNDPPGRKWANQVAASAVSVGCAAFVIELDGLPEHGDVSDWLDAGHTVAELKARVASAHRWTPPVSPMGDIAEPEEASTAVETSPEPEAVRPISSRPDRYGTVCLSDVQPEAVDWLWFGRLALGKLTLIDGDPGLGKSLLSLDSTARVTTGSAWPDGLPCAVSGSVLLLGAEDGLADTVRPRLDVAHAAIHRVHALPIVGERPNGHPPSIPDDIPDIEAALVATGAILLVIDPLMAFLGGKVNAHHDQDVRRALAPLAEMADRLRVAVLVIRHLNKSSGGPAIYRGGGSIGLAGAARIVLAVGADPEDESRRILASVKSNLSAQPPSLAYQLVEERGTVGIKWLGTSTVTAGQLLAAPADADDRSALGDACDFLRDELGNGPVAVKDVEDHARKAGHMPSTLRRARTTLKVMSKPSDFGGPRLLHLPADQQSRSSNASVDHPKTMIETEKHDRDWEEDGHGNRVYG